MRRQESRQNLAGNPAPDGTHIHVYCATQAAGQYNKMPRRVLPGTACVTPLVQGIPPQRSSQDKPVLNAVQAIRRCGAGYL
jgi:hypothetical protein